MAKREKIHLKVNGGPNSSFSACGRFYPTDRTTRLCIEVTCVACLRTHVYGEARTDSFNKQKRK